MNKRTDSININLQEKKTDKIDPLIKTINKNPFISKETFEFKKPLFNMSSTNNTFYPANNVNDKNKSSGLLADYRSQTKDYRPQKRNYNF